MEIPKGLNINYEEYPVLEQTGELCGSMDKTRAGYFLTRYQLFLFPDPLCAIRSTNQVLSNHFVVICAQQVGLDLASSPSIWSIRFADLSSHRSIAFKSNLADLEQVTSVQMKTDASRHEFSVLRSYIDGLIQSDQLRIRCDWSQLLIWSDKPV